MTKQAKVSALVAVIVVALSVAIFFLVKDMGVGDGAVPNEQQQLESNQQVTDREKGDANAPVDPNADRARPPAPPPPSGQ